MKVLFVSSGKSGDVSEIVKNQGESLRKEGIEVDYFTITPGLLGYITSIPKIRKKFKTGNYDLIHAHYILCAFAASVAGRFPLVVSLMGSDVYGSFFFRIAAKLFAKFRWKAIIVKNNQLKRTLNITNAFVIPNGVDLALFRPNPMAESRKIVNFPMDKKIVLFIAYPNRPEKNLELAMNGVRLTGKNDLVFKHIFNISNELIPLYLNAADLLLLTSQWEGSPNVIKEAMACNCPIVATDVGDIKWVMGNTQGCYITSFDPQDIADKIQMALAFNKRTNGRDRIVEIGLDSKIIAKGIIDIYKQIRTKS